MWGFATTVQNVRKMMMRMKWGVYLEAGQQPFCSSPFHNTNECTVRHNKMKKRMQNKVTVAIKTSAVSSVIAAADKVIKIRRSSSVALNVR